MTDLNARIDELITLDKLEAAMAARNAVKHESYKKSANAYVSEMEKILKMIEIEIGAICKNIADKPKPIPTAYCSEECAAGIGNAVESSLEKLSSVGVLGDSTTGKEKTVQNILQIFDGQDYSEAYAILQNVMEELKNHLQICLPNEKKSADKSQSTCRQDKSITHRL